jgi:hypothetical protein
VCTIYLEDVRFVLRFILIFSLKFALGSVAWLLFCHNRRMSNDCRDYEADFKHAYVRFQDD